MERAWPIRKPGFLRNGQRFHSGRASRAPRLASGQIGYSQPFAQLAYALYIPEPLPETSLEAVSHERRLHRTSSVL